jgi:hypothetical protein
MAIAQAEPEVAAVLARYDACEEARMWAKAFRTLEDLWQNCKVPEWMLWSLEQVDYQNEGKLRLFACACARHGAPFLDDPVGMKAIDVAERFAKGATTRADLTAAWAAAGTAAAAGAQAPNWSVIRAAARAAARGSARAAARAAAREASQQGIRTAAWVAAKDDAAQAEAAWQTDQLRQILGDDYRDVLRRARAPQPVAPR